MSSQASLRVLIVEDEALLVMDLESMLVDAGHLVVGEAASLRQMSDIPDESDPDVAFVDINLADGSCGLEVCDYIRHHWAKAIIVFLTANPGQIPRGLGGGHGIIAKPFSRICLMSAIRYIGEGVTAPPPASPPPACFFSSEALAVRWA